MAGRLAGRVAIVTGGGRNLGRAVACAFAAEGARVAVASRSSDRLLETARRIEAGGGEAMAVPTDVTEAEEVGAMVAAVRDRFGPADVLAAFAGGGNVAAPLEALDAATLQRIVAVNLTGALWCARAVLPDMRARGRGSILVAVGGGAFFPEVGTPCVAYAAAKAGLCRMVDQLTAETSDTAIRVNAIDPGQVREGDAVAGAEAARLAAWLAADEAAAVRGRLVSVHDEWWRTPGGVAAVERSLGACRLRRCDPPESC